MEPCTGRPKAGPVGSENTTVAPASVARSLACPWGLSPFVEARPGSGKVGAAVKILGTDLTGATSVSFNDTAAKFAVVSSSDITITVPTGATTGEVKVVTPSGTLSSNVPFVVP